MGSVQPIKKDNGRDQQEQGGLKAAALHLRTGHLCFNYDP